MGNGDGNGCEDGSGSEGHATKKRETKMRGFEMMQSANIKWR